MPLEIWLPLFVFLFAGVVKGVVGLGLPTISLGLMTIFMDIEEAMVLILWPTLLTNLWQACYGGNLVVLVRRLWPFLIAAMLTLGLGTFVLSKASEGVAELVLGFLLIAYGAPMLAGARLSVPKAWERLAGVFFGAANGLFSGFTGSLTVPGVMYLQALGLTRIELVQAMGLLFVTAAVALMVALGGFGLLTASGALVSVFMVPSALAGVIAGQAIRWRLSERAFKTAFFSVILALGLYLVPLGWVRMAAG